MAIRKFRPYTPGTRTRVVTDFSEVTGRKPERSLVVSKHRKKGRNNRGVITCRHRGGVISVCTASLISAATSTA